jgi:hypothetical protein
LKRREEKEEKKKKRRTKRKHPKTVEKRKKTEKNKAVWSHRYIISPQKYCRKDQRSCDGRGEGTFHISHFITSVVQWKEKSP